MWSFWIENAHRWMQNFSKIMKTPSEKLGFPTDFQIPTDEGGPGAGKRLGGFGGDKNFNRQEHQKRIKRTPVILVHGNTGSAQNRKFGMMQIRQYLKEKGYADIEIWAISYLGNGELDLSYAHQDNIEDLRKFIDAVMKYLNVKKVDIIAHSLGATLSRAWMRGLSKKRESVDWDDNPSFDKVGTFVSLAGGNRGINPYMIEWAPDGEFIRELNAGDETPFGKGDTKKLADENRITYVALWAINDLIDQQNPGTGALEGADLNKGYHLGSGIVGHEAILKSDEVFNDFFPYLNRVPFR